MEKKSFVEFILDFYRYMREYEISLVYEGEITQPIIKAFLSLTETKMMQQEEPGAVQRKVFHVMVECLQNVSKYSDSSIEQNYLYAGMGVFIVTRSAKEYCITTGNSMEKGKIDELKKTLEYINSLDKEALNELYKKQIKESQLHEKGGAGLGFIDIKRKTGNNLSYEFMAIDDEFTFFILTSSVSRI
ncbi:MAG: SiaB family protein kinase [Bacteroidales bacterium]|nr:SiaB family protein kinase [Bacteroidales bacterium]